MAYLDKISSAFTTLNLVVKEKKRIDTELMARQEAERLERIAKDNRVRDEQLTAIQNLAFIDVPSILATPYTETADVNPVIRTYIRMFSDALSAEQYGKLESYSKKIITSEPNESSFLGARRKVEPEFGQEAIRHFENLRSIYLGTTLVAVKRVMLDGMLDEEAIVLRMEQLLQDLQSLPDQISERLIGDNEIREIRNKLIKVSLFSMCIIEETLKTIRLHVEQKHPERIAHTIEYFAGALYWAPQDIAKGVFNGLAEQCVSLHDTLNAEQAKLLVSSMLLAKERIESTVEHDYSHTSMVA